MKESETIEFKKSLAELSEGLTSMAAILNKHGHGELWFGIRNDGTATGLQINEKTLRDVSQAIEAHIEPKIYPKITRETVTGKSCLKIAFQGGELPYFAYGRAYMRVSDADRKLSASELERLILEKNRNYRRWDTEISTLSIKDLDRRGIQQFVEMAGLTWSTAENALQKLSLLAEGRLLNTASVFFQTPSPYELRTAVFAGTSSSTLLDQHSLKGGILELVEEAQRYILRNIHIGMKVEGLARVDVPEIDPEAIREAVINAFCHRDYRDPDPVQIAIFQDRVEIRNPGTLIEGITLDDLRKGTVSRRRNPLVADLLRRIKLVESWGRGIPLILEKAPGTRFSIQAGLFVSTMQRLETVSVKASVKASEKASEKTSEKILQRIRKNHQITIAKLSEDIGVSTRTIERNINNLQKSGKLLRKGSAKAGYWEVLTR